MKAGETEFTKPERELLEERGYEVSIRDARTMYEDVGAHDVRLEGHIRKYIEEGLVKYKLTIAFSHKTKEIEQVESTFRKEDEIIDRGAIRDLDATFAGYLEECRAFPGILSASEEE